MKTQTGKRRLVTAAYSGSVGLPAASSKYGAAMAMRFMIGAGLFVLSGLSRILPFREQVLAGGRVLVRDPDACYHLRRAELIARNFPDLTLFDRFMNHPNGAYVIWPPLYDMLLSGLLRLFPAPGGQPGVSLAVASLPPLLFALTTLAIYGLARRLWPSSPLQAILADALEGAAERPEVT